MISACCLATGQNRAAGACGARFTAIYGLNLCRRAWRVYGDVRYERLASISVSHLYNPRLRGVHVDNGSEYINRRVAKLLNKLRVAFTPSRPRHSNDNARVEAKNGGVIRRTFGYAHIPQSHAARINAFCSDDQVPYLNFHRPCLFPKHTVDAKGKVRTTYPHDGVRTPLENLKALPVTAQGLKSGITLDGLSAQARSMTDNDAAAQLQTARAALVQSILRRFATHAA